MPPPADARLSHQQPDSHDGAGTLTERLARLRARAQGRSGAASGSALCTAGEPDPHPLAETLGAEVIAPGVLRLTRCIDPRLRHGRGPLGRACEPRFLTLPEGCAPEDPAPLGADGLGFGLGLGLGSGRGRDGVPEPAPWLALDTETSGLAGGTGTWAFLTGLLRQTPEGWALCQLLLTRLDAEPAYLAAVRDELAAPARLLSYNGRAFDLPLLATRLRLAGLAHPFAGRGHLDLLHPTRRAFARRWPDCRLASAERRLLGFERADDLPGSAAPDAWLGWLRRSETAPLARVLRHNRLDLLSLVGLLPALDAVFADPGARGADVRAVAAAHASRGEPGLALRLLERERPRLDPRGLHDLARLYRRSGNWGRAVDVWHGLAAAGDIAARECLARYQEHRARDLAAALALACGLPPGAERERRLGRLHHKHERAARQSVLEGL